MEAIKPGQWIEVDDVHKFMPVPALNRSGLRPLDHRVVVLRDPAPDKIGAIFLPDQEKQRKKYEMQSATVIAVGEMAWAEAKADALRWGVDFAAPKPSDRVRIGKYAGGDFEGLDGRTYTLCNDEDILGHLEG